MSRTFLTLILAAVFSLVAFSGSASAQADLDCADFASQEAAQAHYNANPSDPDGLDRDNDGYACETFFGYIGDPVVSQPDVDDGDGVTDLPSTGSGIASTQVSLAPIAVAATLIFAGAALQLRHAAIR